jgi:hypothetical protein
LGIKGRQDQYKITYPALYLRGILTGSPFVELIGSCDIFSNTGYHAKLEFLGKPWFSGEYHAVDGFIAAKKDNKPIYKISGKWTGETNYTHVSSGNQKLLFDAQRNRICDMVVKPVEEQGELECRKLWFKVSQALKNQDYANATKEKTAIEEKQRAIRRENKEKGVKWLPCYFNYVESAEDKASSSSTSSLEPTGVWVYKEALVDIQTTFNE